MKYYKPKIVVVPHYAGTKKQTEIFKKIFTEQIEKKLKEKQSTESINNNSEQDIKPDENI